MYFSDAQIAAVMSPSVSLATSDAAGGYTVLFVCDSSEYVVTAENQVVMTLLGGQLSASVITLQRRGNSRCPAAAVSLDDNKLANIKSWDAARGCWLVAGSPVATLGLTCVTSDDVTSPCSPFASLDVAFGNKTETCDRDHGLFNVI